MKRCVSLFVSVLVLLMCLCSCQKDNVKIADTKSSSTEKTAGKNTEKTELTESLTKKLVREIDDAYSEESKLPEYGTTVGMCKLAEKYTEKWKQIEEEYYDKIMKYDGIIQPSENYYSSDDLHTFVSNMKANFEEYNQKQCDNYTKTLETIYGGGTIVGPVVASYKYKMQKEWALQIVDIYEKLYP